MERRPGEADWDDQQRSVDEVEDEDLDRIGTPRDAPDADVIEQHQPATPNELPDDKRPVA